jgi:hypothetical protein
MGERIECGFYLCPSVFIRGFLSSTAESRLNPNEGCERREFHHRKGLKKLALGQNLNWTGKLPVPLQFAFRFRPAPALHGKISKTHCPPIPRVLICSPHGSPQH